MRGARRPDARHGMTVARATIEKVDDAKKMQQVNAKVGHEEQQTDLERAQNYGITSVPKKPTKKEKAEAIILYPGGDRSHGIVIAVDDRRYRLKSLKEGEVSLYDDLGAKVHLTRDGIVISSPKGIHLKAPNILLEGDVDLGGKGGKLLHRKDDQDSAGHAAVGSASKVRAV